MSHAISSILDQVETTSVTHSGYTGHLISAAQVHAIRNALPTSRAVTAPPAPASGSAFVDFQLAELQTALTTLNLSSAIATGPERARLDIERGQLTSRIARLEKAIRDAL